LFFKGEKKL
uniref:Skin secreted peptide P3-1 n=1 Tax=Phasmahyla jandaia TaxID=762504 RepID=SSP31_PHAJA|nr:RecName: Full=Skin secreted peptide P3-1; Short=PjP3-1 [Phasmahyla jandaia]